MQSPVKIEFDGLEPSEAVSARILQRLTHLEKLFPRIVDGSVVVELANHNHVKGNIFRVRIELNVPGDRLVISREPGKDQAHSDVYVAVRDAFDAMERILENYVRKMRQQVKHHEMPLTKGHVCRIFPQDGFGFIKTKDDREVFFDANAVVDKPFDHLAIGSPVRFCEEAGEEGPQASTVHA